MKQQKYNSRNPSQRKLDIIYFIKVHKRKPSDCSHSLDEKRLGRLAKQYLSPSSPMYDENFVTVIKELYKKLNITPLKVSVVKNKEAIKQFIEDNTQIPSQYSEDPCEKRLGVLLKNYTSVSASSYDEKFTREIKVMCETLNVLPKHNPHGNKELIKTFFRYNLRKPCIYYYEDLEEKRLAVLFNSYTHASSPMYDEEFTEEVSLICEKLHIEWRRYIK